MREARQNWSDVVDLVRMHGSSIIITRYGQPVAVISPYGKGAVRYGINLGGVDYTSGSVHGLAKRINDHGRHGSALVLPDGQLKVTRLVDGQATEYRFYEPKDLVVG